MAMRRKTAIILQQSVLHCYLTFRSLFFRNVAWCCWVIIDRPFRYELVFNAGSAYEENART